MKKILTLTIALFFILLTESNGQNHKNYYDIYKIDTSINNPKSNTFSKNNKNSESVNNKYIIKTSNKKTDIKEAKTLRKKLESRTVGNYIGIDFINTYLRYREYNYHESKEVGVKYPSSISYPTFPKHKNSFGLKYSYAINYRRFFLAPELFFEYNNIKKYFDGDNTTSLPNQNQRLPSNYGYKFMKIHRNYGFKINLGYDVTTNFAPYLFAGTSKIYYSNLSSVYQKKDEQNIIAQTGSNPFKIMHKSESVPFFGFGGKIKLSERLALNTEYSIYDFMAKTNSRKLKNYISNDSKFKADSTDLRVALRVAKIGLTYNF